MPKRTPSPFRTTFRDERALICILHELYAFYTVYNGMSTWVREVVSLADMRARASATSSTLASLVSAAFAAPDAPISIEEAQSLLTYKVPAQVVGGACGRAVDATPFDLRSVLFDAASTEATDWITAAVHPHVQRVARLRKVCVFVLFFRRCAQWQSRPRQLLAMLVLSCTHRWRGCVCL
jgi:hypothetical protein